MADTKISALTELTAPVSGDFVPIVDTSAGATKKIDYSRLASALNVANIGALGDAGTTDNRAAIQSAIDTAAAAGGGNIIIPMDSNGGEYWYSGALIMKNNVTLVCENGVKMVLDQSTLTPPSNWDLWPMGSNVLFGNYTVQNYDLLASDGYALDLPVIGDQEVTTTTAGDAANFAIGDSVWVRSTATWESGAGNDYATWLQCNVVTSFNATTGVIGLRHLIDSVESAAEIVNASDTGYNMLNSSSQDTGILQQFPRDAKIIGGEWINNVENAVFCVGNMIDCEIDIPLFNGRAGPGYGNLYAYSVIRVGHAECTDAGFELARSSHSNYVEYNSINVNDSVAATAVVPSIYITEGARDNVCRVNLLVSQKTDKGLVKVGNGIRNTIEVNTAKSESLTSAVGCEAVSYYSSTAAVGTAPVCHDNVITVRTCHADGARNLVGFFSPTPYRNTVRDSRFYGTATNQSINYEAETVASENMVDNCWFETGGIDTQSDTDGFIVRNTHIPDGLTMTTDHPELSRVILENITTTDWPEAQKIDRAFDSILYTSAAAYTRTISIPAGSFVDSSTVIEFEFMIYVNSGTGTDTVSLTLNGNEVLPAGGYTQTAATADIQFRGRLSCNSSQTQVFTSSEYIVRSLGVETHESNLDIESGLSLDDTAYDLVFTFSASAADGTKTMRHGEVKYRKVGHN